MMFFCVRIVMVVMVISICRGMMCVVRIMCHSRVSSMRIVMRRMTKSFFAMKDQKIHAERIKGSDENTCHHSKVGKLGAAEVRQRNGFDD